MAKLRLLRAGHLLLAGATMGMSAPLIAQAPTTTLVGVVRDSAGRPVPGVEVWLRGSDLYTHTGDNGGFRIQGVSPGAAKVTVRRMGYEPTTFELQLKSGQVDSLIVSLSQVATELAGVNVEEERMTRSKRLLSGFWERKSHGFGHYVTRDEIVEKQPYDFTDIVRSTPGVSVVMNNGRKSVRFSRSAGVRGDCPPQYWVDGMRLENATSDEFPPGDVEAVELYAGASTIPPQFAPRTFNVGQRTCGVIVIWTRLPGA
ncbi:MAG: carboxypeptidase regulatory-like domain-containing protein [bacterium]